MKQLEFLVQGSASDPYVVTFTKVGANLNAFCTCPAGENGLYCKHRFGLLRGESKGIVSKNGDAVAVLATWLPGTDLDGALGELNDATQEHEEATKRLKTAKKRVAAAMRR